MYNRNTDIKYCNNVMLIKKSIDFDFQNNILCEMNVWILVQIKYVSLSVIDIDLTDLLFKLSDTHISKSFNKRLRIYVKSMNFR